MFRAAPLRSIRRLGGGLLLFGAFVVGCGPSERSGGDGADPGATSSGAANRPAAPGRLHTPREEPQPHPHDGEGTAIVRPDGPVVASSRGTWTIEWTAGPSGLDPGDAVVLQVSPFWGWTPPQARRPGFPGHTTVSATGAAVEVVDGAVPMTVVARVTEGRLDPGDTLRFVYGDPAGGEASLAQADQYAEEFEEFLIKVDGDGDGFFTPIAESPGIRIVAGRPERLAVAAPGQVRPGEPFDVRIHALDRRDNRAAWPEGAEATLSIRRLTLAGETPVDPRPAGSASPEPPRAFPPSGAGARVSLDEPGLYRLEARLASGPAGRSELMFVDADSPFGDVLWADLHCHSALSDGTGSPAELYAYARDVAGLDVCAVTDHDAHGLHPLAEGGWDVVRAATEAFHDPGRFVTVLGYEWTSWTWGHRNVYYPGAEGEVFSFLEDASDTPQELWSAVAPWDGRTIPHHPLGGPVPVDWSVPSDEERETVVEICSVHGSSEVIGGERGIYRPVEGHSVRDALSKGHRLGILASGDTHDGHPGRRTIGAPANGLAAIRTGERTRAALFAALEERRVYGTSGPRILLASTWGRERPGQVLDDLPAADVLVEVAAPEPVEVIELVGPEGVVDRVYGGGRRVSARLAPVIETRRTTWRYVRVVLADGEMAWDSPWWVLSEWE